VCTNKLGVRAELLMIQTEKFLLLLGIKPLPSIPKRKLFGLLVIGMLSKVTREIREVILSQNRQTPKAIDSGSSGT